MGKSGGGVLSLFLMIWYEIGLGVDVGVGVGMLALALSRLTDLLKLVGEGFSSERGVPAISVIPANPAMTRVRGDPGRGDSGGEVRGGMARERW